MADLKELLTYIARNLVTKPESVSVTDVEGRDGRVL